MDSMDHWWLLLIISIEYDGCKVVAEDHHHRKKCYVSSVIITLYVYVITNFTQDKDSLTDKSFNHLCDLSQVELVPQ